MSTRGCVARLTSKPNSPISFVGRYLHWDNYPDGTGKTLFELWRGHFKRDTKAMLKFLIDDHKAGWSTINGCDFNKPPRYMEPDPLKKELPPPQCFCHGNRHDEANEVTETNASDMGCEYVYAFTEDGKTMVILSSYTLKGEKMIGMFGCGDPNATWKVIGEIKLDGRTPKWDEVPVIQPERKKRTPKVKEADPIPLAGKALEEIIG